jgi:oligopeptide/dipeptide ABC transporter ATP-binding protein
VLAVIVVAAFVLQHFWRFDYQQLTPDLSQGPSWNHPLGTDSLGHDLLAQVLRGTQESLQIAALVALSGAVLGSVVGIIAGYVGGRVDGALMRLVDLVLTLPVIALAGFLAYNASSWGGPSWLHVGLVLGAVLWTRVARLVRGMAMSLRHEQYVQAGRVMGARRGWIMRKHVLPNVAGQVIVAVTILVAVAILFESGLSFIGFGVQPPDTSLGLLVSNAQGAVSTRPWLFYFPGAMIVIIVLAVNFIGDGLRDALDPKGSSSSALTGRLRPLARTEPAEPDEPDEPDEAPAEGARTPNGPVLQVDRLAVALSGKPPVELLRGVSFTLMPGEVLGLVGESGAGKSLICSAVMGMLPRDATVSGSVALRGVELLGLGFRSLQAIRGRRIAFIPQDPMTALNPVLTIGRQIVESTRLQPTVSKRDARARAVELLSAVGITSPRERLDQYPHEVSGGMRQRIVIAIAMANDPELIIADEPTTALDVTVQADVLEALELARQASGASMLFVTHDLGLISGIADRIAVVYAGRVVELAATAQIVDRPAMPYTRALLDAVPRPGVFGGRLTAIPGESPNPRLRAVGCPFAPRCPQAEDRCRTEDPPLLRLGPAHRSACWFSDVAPPVAPEVEPAAASEATRV